MKSEITFDETTMKESSVQITKLTEIKDQLSEEVKGLSCGKLKKKFRATLMIL